MRTLGEDFRQYRVPGEDGDEVQGAFIFPGILSGPSLLVIASASRRWDHVSVSPCSSSLAAGESRNSPAAENNGVGPQLTQAPVSVREPPRE